MRALKAFPYSFNEGRMNFALPGSALIPMGTAVNKTEKCGCPLRVYILVEGKWAVGQIYTSYNAFKSYSKIKGLRMTGMLSYATLWWWESLL